MNKYVVTFVYLKGVETPCVANRLVRASDKRHALDIIKDKFYLLKVLGIDRQF